VLLLVEGGGGGVLKLTRFVLLRGNVCSIVSDPCVEVRA
jgi:hypothetical protein